MNNKFYSKKNERKEKEHRINISLEEFYLAPQPKKLVDVAKLTARFLYSHKDSLDIEDLVLYGKLARRSNNPKHVRLMIIHNNYALDEIQELRDSKNNSYINMSPIEKFDYLINTLEKYNYSGVDSLLEFPKWKSSLSNDILRPYYFNSKFFKDTIYRSNFINNSADYLLIHRIFEEGILWNNNDSTFNLPLKSKYPVIDGII